MHLQSQIFLKSPELTFYYLEILRWAKILAPKVSVKLGAGIVMDSVALEVMEGNVLATRPIYAGKALIDVKINSEIKVFTIRPNVFSPENHPVLKLK